MIQGFKYKYYGLCSIFGSKLGGGGGGESEVKSQRLIAF